VEARWARRMTVEGWMIRTQGGMACSTGLGEARRLPVRVVYKMRDQIVIWGILEIPSSRETVDAGALQYRCR